ncbi:pseudouridine synthase [Burkholderia mallei]|uniref:Dual-specificity RNA pseudouridine synthase RluF n=4 Tax=Burkholderia mallei TaxID=13373 RepID=A2SB68_BURM9|nr:pseudouridine synthase [Burkholderia mallei]ABN01861.1 RNA pseudouridine synthase family protein [Burkholderia mallei NCTC 10229]AIP77689.1 pseudouridine synthase family protein [Burkholderia mallei]AJX03503.1 pseudouridine synthase family protein [Burkholderia mallei]AJX43516.1 pseudouridine synthase family protein [Burkholderia mallei]AJX65617.1 pseudouridine synthase family protein [Burkholderia mallei]
MRTKLTVKNPRPATPGRAPVRSGSLTARKVARPDPKAAGAKPAAAKPAAKSASAAKPAAPRSAANAAPKRAPGPSRPAAASEGKRVAKPRTAHDAGRTGGERAPAKRATTPGAASAPRTRRTDAKPARRTNERPAGRDERAPRDSDARAFDAGTRGKDRAPREGARPGARGATGAKFGGAARRSDDADRRTPRATRADSRARDAAPSSFAGKTATAGKRAPQRADDRYGAAGKRTSPRTERTERTERPARFGERPATRASASGERRPTARAATGSRLKLAQPIKRGSGELGESARGGEHGERGKRIERGDETGLVRLSKRMSELGLCSRREADEWIEKGWVLVDGERIDTLGTKVRADQRIEIDSNARAAQAAQVTILLHKPVGYVSGQAEDGYAPAATLVTRENHWSGDRSPLRFSPQHLRALAPAGRLDIDSTGLLVLTQNGRVAKQLIGEQSDIDKEYLVRVRFGERTADIERHFPAESLAKLRHGLELDGVPLKPAMVSWQNGEQLRFVLREGKKRQIRRMCELVGLEVIGLKRVRMGRVMLGALPQGEWRYLGPDESF